MPIVVPGVGYTPSALTQNQLRQAVANYIGLGGLVAAAADADLISAVDQAIGCATSRLNVRKWHKWLMLQTIDLVVDTAVYDVAELHKDPGRLLQLNTAGAREGRIPFKEQLTLFDEHPWATTSGDPCYYSLDYDLRQLVLDVPVASSYLSRYPQLAFYFYPRVSISETGFVSPPEFDWFIIWHARMELASYRRGGDAMQLAERQADKHWVLLERWDSDTQTDTSV